MIQEVGYEGLGGKILHNLDEAKSLESQLRQMNEQEKLDRKGKGKDGSKERKRDKKARKRVKGSLTSGDEEESTDVTKKENDKKKSKDTSGTSDSEQLEIETSKRKRSKVEKSTNDVAATIRETSDGAATIREAHGKGMNSETKPLDLKFQFGMGKKDQYETTGKRGDINVNEEDTSPTRLVSIKEAPEGSTIIKEGKGSIIKKEGNLLDPSSRHVKVHKPHIQTLDKAIQTENSALLSLMENMIDAMNEEDPDGTESPAAKLKRLLKENKRMRVQLRFWRSRNWLESTFGSLSRLGSRASSRAAFPPPIMDSSSEDDFSRDLSLYFNPVRPPSVLSQGQFSVGSESTTEDYSQGPATERARTSYDQNGAYRAIPSSSQPVKYPPIPSASSPNRTNSDILLETLRKSSNGPFSRNRDSRGIPPSPSEPMNEKLRFKRPLHRFRPRSSGRRTYHSMPTPPILLEPLNAGLLKNTQHRQSPPPLSARLHSTNLQPIRDEVLNLALKSKAPSRGPRQLSSRTIPSLNFGPPEIFPSLQSLGSSSRTPKLSNSLLPLHAVPNSSRVNAQLSPPVQPIKDSSRLQTLPVTQPIESDIQPTTSPRNARNVSRNPSPRFAQPLANTQQTQDGQSISSPSGSPPRSPRRTVTQSRGGHGSATAREQPIIQNGLMVVGRKSTNE